MDKKTASEKKRQKSRMIRTNGPRLGVRACMQSRGNAKGITREKERDRER